MNDKIERSPRQEKQKPLQTLGGTPSLPLVTVDSAREALESHKINGVESKTLRKKSKATDTAYLDATIVRDLDLTFCSPPHRARSRMHLRRYVHVFRNSFSVTSASHFPATSRSVTPSVYRTRLSWQQSRLHVNGTYIDRFASYS